MLSKFFVTTQFFFTLSMTLLLIGSFLAVVYICCSSQHNRYQTLLLSIGVNLSLASFCGIIAVIIFGFRGDGRDWMPDWEHNDIGWSYYFAVIGSLILMSAGVLFVVEARRIEKKNRKLSEVKNQNDM